jgi:hypothetical protein
LLIALAVAALASMAGLLYWIRVSQSQALKITGSYIGFVVAYSLVIGVLVNMAHG